MWLHTGIYTGMYCMHERNKICAMYDYLYMIHTVHILPVPGTEMSTGSTGTSLVKTGAARGERSRLTHAAIGIGLQRLYQNCMELFLSFHAVI